MISPTPVADHVLDATVRTTSSKGVRDLLASLPIVPDNEYIFDEANPERGWREGYLHWYPVGRDRGNEGRVKHAGAPENPIAERVINAIEALIELERHRELATSPGTLAPQSPREAVKRYFDLPPLDLVPRYPHPIRGQKAATYGRDLARRIRVKLIRETRPVEYSVVIEDDGIGQPPGRMHSTLLSLGRSDKPDKPYLIGLFGQGGASAYAASDFTWMISRRDSALLNGAQDGVGWTFIKKVLPPGRRDVYWAYLAAHPDGRVPFFSVAAAGAIGMERGTRIAHIRYDFGPTEPARTLYQSLNHLVFNPVLPYELYTRPAGPADPMWGNGYRLSRLKDEKRDLDKTFTPQPIEKKAEE